MAVAGDLGGHSLTLCGDMVVACTVARDHVRDLGHDLDLSRGRAHDLARGRAHGRAHDLDRTSGDTRIAALTVANEVAGMRLEVATRVVVEAVAHLRCRADPMGQTTVVEPQASSRGIGRCSMAHTVENRGRRHLELAVPTDRRHHRHHSMSSTTSLSVVMEGPAIRVTTTTEEAAVARQTAAIGDTADSSPMLTMTMSMGQAYAASKATATVVALGSQWKATASRLAGAAAGGRNRPGLPTTEVAAKTTGRLVGLWQPSRRVRCGGSRGPDAFARAEAAGRRAAGSAWRAAAATDASETDGGVAVANGDADATAVIWEEAGDAGGAVGGSVAAAVVAPDAGAAAGARDAATEEPSASRRRGHAGLVAARCPAAVGAAVVAVVAVAPVAVAVVA